MLANLSGLRIPPGHRRAQRSQRAGERHPHWNWIV